MRFYTIKLPKVFSGIIKLFTDHKK
ncbi:stage V sporulation protein SpoVM [Pelagirhabdus alkalitolerans]